MVTSFPFGGAQKGGFAAKSLTNTHMHQQPVFPKSKGTRLNFDQMEGISQSKAEQTSGEHASDNDSKRKSGDDRTQDETK